MLSSYADTKDFEMTESKYDFDLIVIGGGCGGIATAREAASLGRKVAVCDFVTPTPSGTLWGLGGTCVNVGCIPKKLMHKASVIKRDMIDATCFGWQIPELLTHDWPEMITHIQNYIKSLNFGYRKVFIERGITYFNAFAQFVGHNKIKITDKKKGVKEITAQYYVIASGSRPRYPNIPGAKEYGITSDDLFSLPKSPGKTLIVGGSFVAVESAGFLNGLGIDCTLMYRSHLLGECDRQIANLVGEHMVSLGIKMFSNCCPTGVEEVVDEHSGRLKVTATSNDETITHEFDTVLFAIGREPCTKNMGLEAVGVTINTENGKIICNESDQTSVNYIFAIGDVVDGRPHLSPIAIHAGRLLSQRLFGKSKTLTDYNRVPIAMYGSLEYGCVGMTEDTAIKTFGNNNIEVYHTHFQPLEYALSGRDSNKCYCKLICVKKDKERIVGLHILGPNASEIVQGFALGIKLGATKADMNSLIGIHRTCAEEVVTLNFTKASGTSAVKTSC